MSDAIHTAEYSHGCRVCAATAGRLLSRATDAGQVIGCDETPVTLLTPAGLPDGPDDVLSAFRGFLMADCWTGFQQIRLRSNPRIVRVACMTHARRKVFNCWTTYPEQPSVLLAMFRQLYDIEDRGKELSPKNRLTLRQSESIPVLEP